jgi:hypothetical protein
VDDDLIKNIDKLVEEEHRLWDHSTQGNALSEAEQERLRQLEVQLDQCWDLLRRRRALRSAGQDPQAATPRSPDVVEHYQQ